jgi:hypothetical protein
MFNPPCRLTEVLTFAAWYWITAMARCEEPPNASPPATAQLVEQLGDASYAQRERAGRQLLEIGLEAKEALDDGMRHPDAEIAFRCRSLDSSYSSRFNEANRLNSLVFGEPNNHDDHQPASFAQIMSRELHLF